MSRELGPSSALLFPGDAPSEQRPSSLLPTPTRGRTELNSWPSAITSHSGIIHRSPGGHFVPDTRAIYEVPQSAFGARAEGGNQRDKTCRCSPLSSRPGPAPQDLSPERKPGTCWVPAHAPMLGLAAPCCGARHVHGQTPPFPASFQG